MKTKRGIFVRGILLLGMLLAYSAGQAQQEGVRWLSLKQGERLYKSQPKPYLFDFYVDKCDDCKQMNKTTYTDPVVVAFINQHFYPVRINAETTDTLVFKEKVYAPVKRGNKLVNGLALEMLGEKIAYPSTVFLYDPVKINLVVPGYLSVTKMQGYLVYLAENAWKTVNVNKFLADFEQVFGEKTVAEEDMVTYWTAFQELEQKQQVRKKKILLFLEGSWNNSSKMMTQIVFPDSSFAAEAQEHFYCLHLDVQSRDTITFLTHTFYNDGLKNNNLHQLAIALSNKLLRVPSIYLFDEEGKLMESLAYYVDREKGRLILEYIGNNVFKNMSWNEYLKMRSRESL